MEIVRTYKMQTMGFVHIIVTSEMTKLKKKRKRTKTLRIYEKTFQMLVDIKRVFKDIKCVIAFLYKDMNINPVAAITSSLL